MIFFLFISGAALILYAVYYFNALLDLKCWEPVKIKIQEFGVSTIDRPEVYVRASYYFPFVKYSYVVSGEEFYSSKVAIDKSVIEFRSREEAEHILNELVEVGLAYYSPKKPSDSVLMLTAEGWVGHLYGIFFSGVLVVFISVFFWAAT